MPLAEGSEKAPVKDKYYIIPASVIRQIYCLSGKVIHHYHGGSLKKIDLTHQHTSSFV
jgi:ribosomal protein S19E (S16A)